MSIIDYIASFFKDFVSILSEMSPYLLLGFFFAGLLYAFIPRNKIEKYFSGSRITSYNVCYTKLLREASTSSGP